MSNSKSIKCVIVGDGAVGKTCMLISYCTDVFPREYVPTIFDNYIMEVMINGESQKVELWDTAGQEEYDHLRLLSYPNTDIFLICYSVVDRTSFNNVMKWHKELQDNWTDENRPVPVILVGNKTDLLNDPGTMRRLDEKNEKPISIEESDALCKKIGALGSIQCSAKSQDNLKGVFDMGVNCVLEYRYNKEQSCSIM